MLIFQKQGDQMGHSEDEKDAAVLAFLARQKYQRQQCQPAAPVPPNSPAARPRGRLTQTVGAVHGGQVFMLGGVSAEVAGQIIAAATATQNV